MKYKKRTKESYEKIRKEFHNVIDKVIEERREKTPKEILDSIESRFYSWHYLSNQQEEDITWLINTLKEYIHKKGKLWKSTL